MALFAKELCALIPCCASPKPVAAAAALPRLKLMTLAGGEKGFVASMVGVEKGLHQEKCQYFFRVFLVF
jgi:hypothetical protein